MKISLVAAAIGAAVLLSGCGEASKVSSGDLNQVRSTTEDLQIGMSQDDVEKVLKKGSFKRLSTSSMNGVAIEEYKIEAYHDDDWNKRRDLFVRFLYFADGTLVEISDRRLDYRENPAISQRWMPAS
jgi:PBP1b-binding outer membrane lipoprotein LpoB